MHAASPPVVQALAFVLGCVAIQVLRRHAELMHEVLVAVLMGLVIGLVVVALSSAESRDLPGIVWDGSLD